MGMAAYEKRGRVFGKIAVAAGALLTLISGIVTGALVWSGAVDEDAASFDATRLAVFLALLWAAVGWARSRSDRLRFLLAEAGLALVGLVFGAFVLGGMDAGGSADSVADVGLITGSLGALLGLFLSWAGARLLWPSTSAARLGQNLPPSQG